MTTLGRAASLRVAYASAMQDVATLTAERDDAQEKLTEAMKLLDYWKSNGAPPTRRSDVPTDRESLGQLVRETWVDFCKRTQLNPKPSHIAPWDEISAWDKEADCEIGHAIRQRMIDAGVYWSGEVYVAAKRLNAERDAFTARAEAAEAEVGRLRDALEFYADATNYRSYWNFGRLLIIEDLGKIARDALAQQKEAPHD